MLYAMQHSEAFMGVLYIWLLGTCPLSIIASSRMVILSVFS